MADDAGVAAGGREPQIPWQSAAREFFRHIEESGCLPAGALPADAASAVLCSLADRLSAADTRAMFTALPASMRTLLMHCDEHRDQAAQVLNRQDFLLRVSEHFRIPPPDAEELSRTVLGGLKRVLPEAENGRVAAALPDDVASIWAEA